MLCPNCGREIKKGAAFCSGLGGIGIYKINDNTMDEMFYIEPNDDGKYVYKNRQYSYDEIDKIAEKVIGINSDSFEIMDYIYDDASIMSVISEY